MPTRHITLKHLFAGGWATDFGPSVSILPDDARVVRMPHLLTAKNCVYDLDGGPQKIPGSDRLVQITNLSSSGQVLTGIFDYWKIGTSGTPTQQIIIGVSSNMRAMDGTTIDDGAAGGASTIDANRTNDEVFSFAVFEDDLLIASDKVVPRKWNQSGSVSDLGGTPPNFAWVVVHKNRVWAGGDDANPSRLYYSELLDSAIWLTGASGSIDIDPSDGDRLTGAVSYKNELFVFKGPYKGSIHRISGSSPTGPDPFGRATFANGIGCVAHNTIFPFRGDIGFMNSDGRIHSLSASADFGDFDELALTRPIDSWIQDNLNIANLYRASAQVHDALGLVLFSVPLAGADWPNVVLAMDYRFNPVRWAYYSDLKATALASVIDQSNSNRRTILHGFNEGPAGALTQLRRWGKSSRTMVDTAIDLDVESPFMDYGTPGVMKTIAGGSVGIGPKNDGDITFGIRRDDKGQQTVTINQGGKDSLSPTSGTSFTLGTSELADSGARFVDKFFQGEQLVSGGGGEFRSIQIQIRNNVDLEDVELHSFGLRIEPGGESMEN